LEGELREQRDQVKALREQSEIVRAQRERDSAAFRELLSRTAPVTAAPPSATAGATPTAAPAAKGAKPSAPAKRGQKAAR
jgi:hypothetical protein